MAVAVRRVVLPLLVVALAPGARAATAGAAATRGYDARVLVLLNHERAERHLAPLHLAPRLSRAALVHSRDMVVRDYFAHDTLGGETWQARILTFYRPPVTIGEDIGWGAGTRRTPAAMVRAWMRSPPHRANILRPGFTSAGIGVAAGTFLARPGAVVYTADFGG